MTKLVTKSVVENAIRHHLTDVWAKHNLKEFVWTLESAKPSIVREFRVLALESEVDSEPAVYASCGAWQAPTNEDARYEFFLLAPDANAAHVETLTMLSNFHSSGEFGVEPGKIISLGRSWVDGANCDHILVSVPYLIEPNFEFFNVPDTEMYIRLLWLMPITAKEAEYGKEFGVEKLENLFESCAVDVLNFHRNSCV